MRDILTAYRGEWGHPYSIEGRKDIRTACRREREVLTVYLGWNTASRYTSTRL
jgi:hypothetical protein